MKCFVVARFLLTSVSHALDTRSSATAQLLVFKESVHKNIAEVNRHIFELL